MIPSLLISGFLGIDSIEYFYFASKFTKPVHIIASHLHNFLWEREVLFVVVFCPDGGWKAVALQHLSIRETLIGYVKWCWVLILQE